MIDYKIIEDVVLQFMVNIQIERYDLRLLCVVNYIIEIDRDKSQSRQIQITEVVISDEVAKRDNLVILPTKELVDKLITWRER